MSTILQAGAVYLTPSGRLATLARPHKFSRNTVDLPLHFLYLSRDGKRAIDDGFYMRADIAKKALQMVARAGTVEA